MPPTHLSGTARALYRVFVAPNLRASSSIPLFYAPAFAPSCTPSAFSTPSLTPHITVRGKKYAKDTRRRALSDYYVIDRAIEAKYINLVDEDGTFRRNYRVQDALNEMNKVTHHLVQLTEGKVDEYGNIDPNDLPTCRIVTKVDLRAQHERKLELERRQATGKGTGPAPKSLELNWAIAGGDLGHRLGRLKDFLLEGRKVEITLGPKRKGKQATEDEAAAVMSAIREAVAECRGVREKSIEGQVGGVMTVVFEGPKVKEGKGKKKKSGEEEEEEDGGAEENQAEEHDEMGIKHKE